MEAGFKEDQNDKQRTCATGVRKTVGFSKDKQVVKRHVMHVRKKTTYRTSHNNCPIGPYK